MSGGAGMARQHDGTDNAFVYDSEAPDCAGRNAAQWTYESEELSEGHAYSVYDADDQRLTEPYISEANACLIAAAPELLAELKRDLQFAREMKGLIEALKGKRWVQHTMALSRIEMLTAAIARATVAS